MPNYFFNLLKLEKNPTYFFQSPKDGDPAECTENLIAFLKDILSDRLKGEVTFTQVILQDYNIELAHIAGRIDESEYILGGGMQSIDASVIYNIQCLMTMLTIAEDKANCAGLFYSVLKKEGQKVCLSAPDSNGPEMSVEIAEKLLTNLQSKKWTLETLKKKIPEECKSAVNEKEICPDIEAGYRDVIKTFEVRTFI
jgi:hypothetical protein